MADQSPLDPTDAFAELGRIRLSENDPDAVLQKVAELAKRTIPGAAEVSVTLVRNGGPYTAAFTGDIALALDERQYQDGTGPCLNAAATTSTISVPDIAGDDRWPNYLRQAFESGVRSALSVGLPVQHTITGALNLYATEPDAFDDDAVRLAQTFSGYAAVALANAHLYDATATLAQQMQGAMEHRAVIEQAKGIIMGDRHCSADEAFRILSALSRDTDRKLREVAEALVARARRDES